MTSSAGPAASLAVDEIAATMGYVVGKLAKAPDGSRIQFDLTGPLARTIRVSVDGRAAVVDDFGGQEPTATIRLDGLQFTRLTGGRPMCPARAQDIEFGGDTRRGRSGRRAPQLRDLIAARRGRQLRCRWLVGRYH